MSAGVTRRQQARADRELARLARLERTAKAGRLIRLRVQAVKR